MSMTISDFYEEKNVFITGATGFVGKLLLEKLLFSCEKINKIYVLIREKNGHSADQRLNDITACKVFDKLRTKEPTFRERIQAVTGDILENNLKLSESLMNELQQNVNVVFHLAGTVILDQDLK